jgi:hypothetical protein
MDTNTNNLYNIVLDDGVTVIKNAFPKIILIDLAKEFFYWPK